MPSERTPSAAGWHYVACLALVATCASGLPLTSPPAAHKYLHTPQQQQQLLSVTAPQPLTYVAASAAVRRAGLRDDDPSAGSLSEEDLLKALGALQALEEESEVLGYLASIRSGSRGRQIRREVASSEAALESLLLEALARRDRELQTRQAEQREREEREEEQEEEDEEVREVLADQARRMPRDGRLFAPLYDARSRNGELGVGNAEAEGDDGDDDDDEEEEEEVGGGGTADDGYGDVEEELQENREARWRSGDIDDNDNDQEQDDEEEEEEGEEGADGDRREAGEARELLQLLEALQGRDTRQSEGDGRAGRRPTAGGRENVRSVTVMNARHRDAKAGDQRPRLLKQQQQQLERQEEEALDQAANLLLHYALQAGENGDAAASRSRGFARPRSPAPGQGERADGRQRARPAARDQAPEEEEDDEEEEEEARRAEGEPTAELENLVKLLLLQEARGDDRDDAEKQPRQRGDGERRGEASGKGVGSASRDGWQDASARGRRGPKDQKRAGPTEERGDAAAGAEEEEEVEDEDEEEQGLNRAAKSRQSAKEEDGGDDARGDAAAEVEKQENEVLRDLLQYLKLDEEARREEGPSAIAGAGRRPDAPRSAVDDDARIVEELSKFVVDDAGGGGDSDGADDVEDTVEVEDLEEEDDDDDDEDRRKRVSPSRRRQKGRGPGAEPRLDLEGLLVELLQGAARGNAGGGEATRHAPAPLRFKEKAS